MDFKIFHLVAFNFTIKVFLKSLLANMHFTYVYIGYIIVFPICTTYVLLSGFPLRITNYTAFLIMMFLFDGKC